MQPGLEFCNSVFRKMESEAQIQYVTLDEPILPSVAAQITEEQKRYNPLLDPEAPELQFEVLLFRAGLHNYANVIINDHGIASLKDFMELQEGDIKLFCRVARDRVLFRKLLSNTVRNCLILQSFVGRICLQRDVNSVHAQEHQGIKLSTRLLPPSKHET